MFASLLYLHLLVLIHLLRDPALDGLQVRVDLDEPQLPPPFNQLVGLHNQFLNK